MYVFQRYQQRLGRGDRFVQLSNRLGHLALLAQQIIQQALGPFACVDEDLSLVRRLAHERDAMAAEIGLITFGRICA